MALLLSFPPEAFRPAASTNFPQYVFPMAGGGYTSALAFDPAVSEKCESLQFAMPTFTAPLTLRISFAIAATTGGVDFRAQVQAIASGDAININTSTSFDTANSSGTVSVPATTYNPKDFTITLTNNDSVVAGERVTFTLDRNVAAAGDDAAGDCFVLQVDLEDAS
ncbi:MAG: hypothetical protein EBR90_02130 [Actinobacteria bacterium]|nr:hypothetical protein [Actinomycetota bacterium]